MARRPPPKLKRSTNLRENALAMWGKVNNKSECKVYTVTECIPCESEGQAMQIAWNLFKTTMGKERFKDRIQPKTQLILREKDGESVLESEDMEEEEIEERMEMYYSKGDFISSTQAELIHTLITDTCSSLEYQADEPDRKIVPFKAVKDQIESGYKALNMKLAMEDTTLKKTAMDVENPVEISGCKSRGVRKENEDFFLVLEKLGPLLGLSTDGPMTFLGLYDGHSGSHAAEYCMTHLHMNICRNEDFSTNILKALEHGFVDTDKHFNEMARVKDYGSGTTATVAFVTTDSVFIGSCGDSRAYVCRKSDQVQGSEEEEREEDEEDRLTGYEVVALTKDHHPVEEEKERVEKLGAKCVWYGCWRVNGTLAVTRSIGDKDFRDVVIALPGVCKHEIGPDDEFLLLASDGVWGVMDGRKAAKCIIDYVKANGKKDAASALVLEALKRGGKDNISVIVYFF